MAGSGFPISFRKISGPVQVIALIGQVMHSIVLKYIASGALIIFSSSLFAAEPGPRILSEPVLGLRYEAARVKFDLLPAQALSHCETMQATKYRRSVSFIFAQAEAPSGRTYYISGGYEIRNDERGYARFQTGNLGAVFFTEGKSCTYIDTARQVFEDRLFDEELPESVLKLLAADIPKRFEKAFGGADRLRAELRKQHVDKSALPPELLASLKPYFTDQ